MNYSEVNKNHMVGIKNDAAVEIAAIENAAIETVADKNLPLKFCW